MQGMNTGLVVTQHGRHVWVEDEEGNRRICHARGKKNECVVGDQVLWQPSKDEGTIEKVLPRSSLLYRQDDIRSKQFAANIDQVLVVLAAVPVFSEELLFRALIACEAAQIKAKIVLNKSDLEVEHTTAFERLKPYVAMDYEVISLSIKHQQTQAQSALQAVLVRKKTLVLGASGVGKSSLVNLLLPNAQIETQEISDALNSGKHTTTQTTWYWLDEARSSALIDSPGFQEFGVHHIDKIDLPKLMPDLAPYLGQCKFYNCTHLHEPQCAVLAQVGQTLSAQRHAIYARLFEMLGQTRF